MKMKTDPSTGVTTCELSKQDRSILAGAKTILEKLAFNDRGTVKGDDPERAANYLADLLGGGGAPV